MALRRSVVTDALFVALGRAGVCLPGMEWASLFDDLRRAWESCDRGDWVAQTLVNLGFDFDRVVGVVIGACEGEHHLKMTLELMARDDRTTAGVVRIVNEFSRRMDVSLGDIAGALREEFSYDEALSALERRVSSNQAWKEFA